MNQHVCRCCLLENPAISYNIFDEASNLLLDLLHCAPMKPDDGLPELICELCSLRLRAAVDFRHRCEESDRELRKRYDDENKAIEEVLGFGGILTQIDREVNGLIVGNGSNQEADKIVGILGEDAAHLADFEPLEISMLNDLLLDTYSLSSIPDLAHSVRTNEEDHTITDLLNRVLDDNSFDNAPVSILTNGLIDNTSSEQSSSTDIERNCYGTLTDASSLLSTATINTATPKIPAVHVIENIVIQQANSTCAATFEPNNDSNPYYKTAVPQPKATNKKSLTPKSLHPCPECEKKFTRNFQLKLHLISVHNIGDGLQYTCTECQMTFASRHSLSYHQKKIHSEERPFACMECSRRFILKTQLASHMRIHTGDTKPRIYQCPSEGCDKSWPTKSDLRTHMRTHDPNVERKWSCDRCEKSFFTRGHLNSHILVHTGQKPYSCALCEKSYQSVGNLNNHMYQHHGHLILAKLEPENLLET